MSLLAWLDQRPALQCAGISVLLNLAVEILSRRSIIAGLGFLALEPVIFLYNAVIIMFTMSLTLLARRRYFGQIIISAFWIVLGAANYILQFFRSTPLAAIDLQMLASPGALPSVKFGVGAVLVFVAAIGVGTGLIAAWRKLPARRPKYLAAISAVLVTAVLIAVFTPLLLEAGLLSSDFGNLAEANKRFGFIYCFSRSMVDRGIDRPANYSENSIAKILSAICPDAAKDAELKPNIIMVQLESFFDVNYLEGVRFSQNPVPVFTALKESCPHGFLTVPSFGVGTANTEFEVLTGMNLDYFGAGEYPYLTVLQNNSIESICYNLSELGYTNHAIHNNDGTFYTRHLVFSNLGFNTFLSLEYMNDVECNPLGWAKDMVLTKEVMKALSSTEEQDFVYAITVQAHGRYPHRVIDKTQRIDAAGINGTGKIALEYYVNQLYETDAFIGALISELAAYEEPVALVLFGDHLPGLDIDDGDLMNRDRFETEYVIWSNYNIEAEGPDLSAYQLGAHVLKELGISQGVLTKLHQTYMYNDKYQEALELLEYDLVHGRQFAYGEENRYDPTQLRMGIDDISITDIRFEDETAYVIGAGFTEWSKVLIDDRLIDTIYIDDSTLRIPAGGVGPGAELVVVQLCGKTRLSQTGSFQCP